MPHWRSFVAVPAVACLAVTGLTLGAGATAPARAAGGQMPLQAASGCFPAGGRTVPEAPAPAPYGIIIRGHGWGHGLGMSQYGAQGAARLGCSHAQILGTYYTGTHLERRLLAAPVVLALETGAARATVLAENGRVVWVAPGGTLLVQPAGQTWTVHGYSREGIAGTVLLDGAGTLRLFVPTGTLTLAHATVTIRVRTYPVASNTPSSDRRLRWGTTGFARTGSGYAVEETIASDTRGTSVDKYLWGLGEVPVSWPGEALRSQADAARTYLARSYATGAYRIGVTTAAQVYAGASREDEDARYRYPWRTAVNATSGEVIVDGSGEVITAMYFSSSGGRSQSRAYVYGSQGGFGYLSGVDDSRWDLASGNPYRSWATAFTPERFATALGFGTVTGISMAGPGTAGRAGGMKVTGVVDGATRTVAFTGAAARKALGLRSPGFTVSWVRQPPPPPAVPEVQPLVGDWDGDGADEVGVFRSGRVTLRMDGGAAIRYPLGRSDDIAVVGDWDGDGRDSVGVFRSGMWYLRNALSAGPFDRYFGFGRDGDRPVTGYWAGAGHQGIGVVRGSRWHLRPSATAGPATWVFTYGVPGDRALSGDWNGDGADTPAVFRGGAFYLLPGLTSGAPRVVRLGWGIDTPVAGNWDRLPGDGVGVYRGQVFLYRDDLAGGVATRSVVLAG